MLRSAAAPHRRKTTTYTRPDNTLASHRPKRATAGIAPSSKTKSSATKQLRVRLFKA